MKKIFLMLNFLFAYSILHAQNWNYLYDISKYAKFSEKTYKTISKTNVYDKSGNVITKLNPNYIFYSSKIAFAQERDKNKISTFDYMIGSEDGWVSTDDIVLMDSDLISDTLWVTQKNCSDRIWIPVWYNNLFNKTKTFENYSEYYKKNKNYEEFYFSQLPNIEFRHTFLIFFTTDSDSAFAIKRIHQRNHVYDINVEIDKSAQNYFNEIFEKESLTNLPDLTVNRETTFLIEQNGNRLRFYNGENYKLIIELMTVNKNWVDMMIKYIESDYKTKPSNLKPIDEKLEHPWSNPKTGLYEGSFDTKSLVAVQSTNVSPNQNMTVRENLKLRSGEDTSTQVLAVMSAGAKVRILELGKAETIDGIPSNWVKVEVQQGAKGRDGKPIKKGTVGWCFGGYLE